jgi:hypothetical protein
MTRIYLDIETVPDMRPGAREAIRAEIKAPASYKKAESIAAWLAEEGEAAAETSWRKTALDAAAGEIISISWCSDDMQEAQAFIRAPSEDEHIVLLGFFGQLQEHLVQNAIRTPDGRELWESDPFFICHNASFDLGFLWRRSIVRGIRPPFKLPAPDARPGAYGCTMKAWAGYKDTISLDRLCRALGVSSPKADGMDGSQVFDLWQARELEAIAEYNRRDVLAVREIWRRLNWEVAA